MIYAVTIIILVSILVVLVITPKIIIAKLTKINLSELFIRYDFSKAQNVNEDKLNTKERLIAIVTTIFFGLYGAYVIKTFYKAKKQQKKYKDINKYFMVGTILNTFIIFELLGTESYQAEPFELPELELDIEYTPPLEPAFD